MHEFEAEKFWIINTNETHFDPSLYLNFPTCMPDLRLRLLLTKSLKVINANRKSEQKFYMQIGSWSKYPIMKSGDVEFQALLFKIRRW